MRRPWLGLSCAALVTERAAPLNPLRRLLRRPAPVSDARTCVEINFKAPRAIDAPYLLDGVRRRATNPGPSTSRPTSGRAPALN